MTDDTYTLSLAVFDSGEARDKLRTATQVILSLETGYGDAIQEAAEAEAFYRLRLAEQFRAHRDAGAPVEAANIMARGDVAALKQIALETSGKLRLAEKRLDDAVRRLATLTKTPAHYLSPPCGFCKGTGVVVNALSWIDGKAHPALPCPRCGGKGTA